MSSPTQSEWIWDYATGKYVYWDLRGFWVDANGQLTSKPQRTPDVPMAPQPSSSRSGGRSSKAKQPSGRTSGSSLGDLTASIEKLNVDDRAASSTILTDQSTQKQIQVDVTNTISYQDPGGERLLNMKRIREAHARQDRKPSKEDVAYFLMRYSAGRVIEVELGASDDASPVTAVSMVTASTASGIRTRRFVVTRPMADRHCFEAIAIKTNRGHGVAEAGIIKAHHTIIYTPNKSGKAPKARKDEERTRGGLDDGMFPDAILVTPLDMGTALDPMARLDYADKWQFDWYAPNIRLFGAVHENFLPAMWAQYNTISQRIDPSIETLSFPTPPTFKGITPSRQLGGSNTRGAAPSTAGATTGTNARETDWSSEGATRGSSSRLTAGPSNESAAGSSDVQTPQSREETAKQIFDNYRSPKSGPCSDEEMRVIVVYLQIMAKREDVTPPANPTPAFLHELAQNAEKRKRYIDTVRAKWVAEKK